MVWDGVATENLGPVVKVIDFVEIGELLGRKELSLQSQKKGLGLICDLVGEVEVP